MGFPIIPHFLPLSQMFAEKNTGFPGIPYLAKAGKV